MTSANNLLKKLIGVKNIVITDCRTYDDSNGVRHLEISAHSVDVKNFPDTTDHHNL